MARCALPILAALLLLGPQALHAQSIIEDREPNPDARPWFLIPYAFQTDVLDTAFAVAVGGRGILQDQTTVVANALWSTNDSYAAYLFAENFQLPWGKRLFVSPRLTAGRFGEIESYREGNPRFSDERAGTNGSDSDNLVKGEGTDEWYRIIFKYVLPMGDGRDTIVPHYVLDQGLLHSGASGGESWNPFRSGRMLLELEPFYREQDVEVDRTDDSLQTAGLSFTLRHENVDFLPNPVKGRVQSFTFIRDWGTQGSESSYRVWEAEWSEYFSLGASERFRQRVLALNFWTADTPSWKERFRNGEEVITHRPPPYFGVTLGGIDRLRGYPTDRFSDKAAVYYTAELRLVPRWHPLGQVEWLRRFLQIDWWQIVPFVELGRVASSWNLSELHNSMKWSTGLGIRGMVNHLVVRADFAASREDFQVQMFISHPFPTL